MNDPDARYAYFHTTKGVLSGNPNDEDTVSVKGMLDKEGIACLYNPDLWRIRPVFLAKHDNIVGRAAIEAYIESLRR